MNEYKDFKKLTPKTRPNEKEMPTSYHKRRTVPRQSKQRSLFNEGNRLPPINRDRRQLGKRSIWGYVDE